MSGRLSGEAIPQIAPGFRFQWEEAQQAYVILYPEGMVKLKGSAGEILKRCDGASSLDDILSTLRRQFPGVEIEDDVRNFLEDACDHGWIRLKRPA